MRVAIARVGRALGVRGDVLIDVLTDEPERRLAPGCTALLGERSLSIATSRPHGRRWALHFDGVDDRSAAEALTGSLLEIEREPGERPDDPESFYDDELLGLHVRTTSGDGVGVVSEVIHLPAQDLLAVRTDDGREILIPFVTEIVPTVDLERGRVLIDAPEGLLDAGDDSPESSPSPG